MSLTILPDLLAQAKRLGATAADAVGIESVALSTSRRLGKPEQMERAESKEVGLRVFVGKRIACVSGSDMRPEALKRLAEHAVAVAKASTEDPFSALASEALLAEKIPALDLEDAGEPSAEWLQELCAEAEEAALAVKGVTNSEGAEAGYSRSAIMLATSNGFSGSYAATSFSVSATAVAGEGGGMERDYDFASAHHAQDLPSPAVIGTQAGGKAVARLNPRKPVTGKTSVVYDPRVSKSLLSGFAAAINGAQVARGTTFLKDFLGKALFAPGITITDDPCRLRGLASRPFDGEGVATTARNLVEGGVLRTWLLDMRSASQLGMKTTGNASRGLSSPPSPAPSNLYMQPGSLSPAALMSDIKSGFYVTETFGSGFNLITGDYSVGASGFWIENGRIAYPVNEVTIAGTLAEIFRNLVPADDLSFKYAINAPTLRVDGLTVAGQ